MGWVPWDVLYMETGYAHKKWDHILVFLKLSLIAKSVTRVGSSLNTEKNIYNFVVSTVSADGHAPSAGTVMMKFASNIYIHIGMALKELRLLNMYWHLISENNSPQHFYKAEKQRLVM